MLYNQLRFNGYVYQYNHHKLLVHGAIRNRVLKVISNLESSTYEYVGNCIINFVSDL